MIELIVRVMDQDQADEVMDVLTTAENDGVLAFSFDVETVVIERGN
jgi:hypothetical protein